MLLRVTGVELLCLTTSSDVLCKARPCFIQRDISHKLSYAVFECMQLNTARDRHRMCVTSRYRRN